MPGPKDIVWIVEDEQALNQGASKECGAGETRLPCEDGLPTWVCQNRLGSAGGLTGDIANELPTASRREEERPVILASRRRRTGKASMLEAT